MKSDREHRVPLSRAAISVLKDMQARHQDDLVFLAIGAANRCRTWPC